MAESKTRSGRVNDFQRGAISTLRAQGVTLTKIAQVLGLHENTIQRQLQFIEESGNDPFEFSKEIIKNTLPLAALKQAQAVMSEDNERADQASYRMLKGGGTYSEHVQQTTRSIPDAEINAGLTDMLLQALSDTAVDTEYTVSDPVDSLSASPGTQGATIDNPPNVGHGRQTTQNQPNNNAEAPAKQLPSTRPTAVEQVRNSGETLGKLIAKENAKRFTANASDDSITGATSIPDSTRDDWG